MSGSSNTEDRTIDEGSHVRMWETFTRFLTYSVATVAVGLLLLAWWLV